MTHADFRGTPIYFAVFKMMISRKNGNQNMLKIPYFFKICKVLPSSGGSSSRSQLASSNWELCTQTSLPRAILPTPTLLLQNVLSLSPFSLKVLRRKF